MGPPSCVRPRAGEVPGDHGGVGRETIGLQRLLRIGLCDSLTMIRPLSNGWVVRRIEGAGGGGPVARNLGTIRFNH